MGKEAVLETVIAVLDYFKVDYSHIKIWPDMDDQVLHQGVLLATRAGIKEEIFEKKYNEFVGVKSKEAIEHIRKEVFFENFNITSAFKNVKYFYEQQPFFFDRNQLYWFWNSKESRYEQVDETDIIIQIGKILEEEGVVTKISVRNYLRCIQTYGREHIPKEAPKHWIQFKNKIFDLKTKEIFEATPEWFLCNPIPFEIGKTDETPIMDKLFSEWVGEEHKQTLYEILAYCCLCDYPIHSLFCFIGSGRNGKSRFLALLNKFIGGNNCISTELDALTESRFESAKLYRKSVCFMGETNFGIMEKTSLIKKLTGQDLLGGEFKGKNPFDFVNYAKLCISSNSLPSSTDTSEGFYRRWLIIDFPNEFEEGKDILDIIPEHEYNNLSNKVIGLLPKLLNDGHFTNQGSIEQRKQKYIMASNPLSLFIKKCCDVDVVHFVKTSDLYLSYLHYLQIHKRRRISRKEFARVLEDEGYYSEKAQLNYDSGYFIKGLKLKENWEKIVTAVTNVTCFTPYIEKIGRSEKHVTISTNVTEIQRFINTAPKIYLPCKLCRLNPTSGNLQDEDGTPICELCYEGRVKGEEPFIKDNNK